MRRVSNFNVIERCYGGGYGGSGGERGYGTIIPWWRRSDWVAVMAGT